MSNEQDVINLKEKFHQYGYKYTEQRKLILDVLLEHKGLHLSNDDICEYLKQKKINIGQSTVYRALIMFEKMNIVRRADLDDGYTRYELLDNNQGHAHHHLICTNCGSVTDIKDDLLEDLEQLICNKYNFEVKDHSLKFYGLCKNCK